MVGRAEFQSRCTQVQSASLSLRIHSLCSRGERADRLAVVFVPGLGASCRTMLPPARLMPGERDVFIVDLPSHGESEKPSRPLSLAEYAAVMAAWHGRLLLDWGPIPGSYGWVFPKGDSLTVGVIAERGRP